MRIGFAMVIPQNSPCIRGTDNNNLAMCAFGQFLAEYNFSDFIFTIIHKSVKKQHDDDNDHD